MQENTTVFLTGDKEEATYVVYEDNGSIKLLFRNIELAAPEDLWINEGVFFEIMSFNFNDEGCIDRYSALEGINDGQLKATLANTHLINDTEHKEYAIQLSDFPGDIISCWIEGIGASWSDPYISWTTFFPYTTPHRPTFSGAFMLECRQNGEIIFKSKDFSRQVEYSSIRNIVSSEDSNIQIFDLQGRKVVKPQKGQIYIHPRGDKFVI